MAEILDPIELHLPPELELDDEKFFQFCLANHALQIERTASGDILIKSPEAARSSNGSFNLSYHFGAWAEENNLGEFFGSATGFILPNKATRSPAVAWVARARLNQISERDGNRFLPLCPDFVLEVRSPTDRLSRLREKMAEYQANGARLGWLIDPTEKKIHISRPDSTPEILDNPEELSGENVLPGFRLPVPKIWAAVERRR